MIQYSNIRLKACLLFGLIAAFTFGLRPSRAAELTEFDSVEKAAAFGWKGASGATLGISADVKSGNHPLEAKGNKETKPYAGLELTTSLDLAKAGNGDQIVFDVKQNFGTSLWVNVNGGEVYQSVRLQKGEWTRIALDMDLSQWTVKKGVTQWPVLKTISFYAKAFDGPDKQLLIDGLKFVVQGKEIAPPPRAVLLQPNWKAASENSQAWFIGDNRALWAISKKNGQVLGGWNSKTKEQYLYWEAGDLPPKKYLILNVRI